MKQNFLSINLLKNKFRYMPKLHFFLTMLLKQVLRHSDSTLSSELITAQVATKCLIVYSEAQYFLRGRKFK